MPEDFHGKITRLSFNADKFAKGEEFDVQVPADLDQFWGDDSHSTVVSGESLVQLRHHSSNGGFFFKKINVVSGTRQVQGGLHSRNTTPYHQHRAFHGTRHRQSPLLESMIPFPGQPIQS
jgi:hypothetical protein